VKKVHVVLIVATLLPACDAILGLSERYPETEAGFDASGDTGSSGDAGSDARRVCPVSAGGVTQLDADGCWALFDTKLLGITAGTAGFVGAAFDGHYLYLAPNPGSIVVRYDTTRPFDAVSSWAGFDLTHELGIVPVIQGATFDGRYVTFVPNGAPPENVDVLRYDTQAAFADPASWGKFDPTTLDPNAYAFAGATFDGAYLYLVPNQNEVAIRYRVSLPFDSATSWEAFDLTTLDPDIDPYFGAVFDGRYVYFAPNDDGLALRYDTKEAFITAAAWTTFDTTSLAPDAGSSVNFQCAAFDGKYVYFVPGEDGPAVRFDTSGSFTDASAWSTMNPATFSDTSGFFSSAAFDGRFLYLLPYGYVNSVPNGILLRYDTTGPFASAWSTFDISSIGPALLSSAAFDGQYLYGAPVGGSLVARFEAWGTRRSVTLPAYFGSFF
jgi:hypothetical protein